MISRSQCQKFLTFIPLVHMLSRRRLTRSVNPGRAGKQLLFTPKPLNIFSWTEDVDLNSHVGAEFDGMRAEKPVQGLH